MILQSAVQLFGEKGYHATSIQDICDLAGVSKGALFHYFENKNELLFEIHETITDLQYEQSERVINNNDMSASEKLRALIDIIVRVIVVENRPYGMIIFQEFRNVTGYKSEIVIAKRDRLEAIVVSVIEQGIMSGEFRQDMDSKIFAKLFFSMCNGLYHWYKPEGSFGVEKMADTIWGFFVGGLRPSSL